MTKFLNSEQAKAEAAWSEAEREELMQEVEQLRRRNAALAELLGQYALTVAELEVKIKEISGQLSPRPHLTPQPPSLKVKGETEEEHVRTG